MDSVGKDSIAWNSAAMVKAVSILLNEIINENKNNPNLLKESKDQMNGEKHIFSAKKPPSISIQSYLDRIIKYSKIEESTLIIMLILIDRFCDKSQIHLNDTNIHRIILATSVLAVKYNEDDYYSNEYYAKVGGVSLKELNQLELQSILMLDHSLFIDDEFFNKYKIYLKHYLN